MGRTRFRLVPRDERFFELFARASENVREGAQVLLDLVEHYEEVDRKVRHLKDIEHLGDEMTHTIFDALNRSFVTPFDRDDVSALTSALDDVVDWIEEAAKRLLVYRIEQPTPIARRFARIIADQAESIHRAVPLLERVRHEEASIRREMVELHRLENEGDDLKLVALAQIYEGVTEVPALVRAVQWADIYEVLEEATDKAERVGIALENIIVKHA
jgi:uncharacterized protein